MNRQPRIGFNMNPQWVYGCGLEEFLDPLVHAGLNTLEFELDNFLPEWDQVQPLMEDCSALGLEFCFHAPHRRPHRVDGFSGDRREEIAARLRPMLAVAGRWAERQGRLMNVVIHGAVSRSSPREELFEDTLQVLAWALDEFPQLCFAFENAHPPAPGEIKIGDSRAEVLEIVTQLDQPRLGICWDMGHDYLSRHPGLPEEGWLSRVIHVHVHDVNDKDVDHYPLVFQRVPYETWLGALRSVEARPTVILEIKGGLLAGWQGEAITEALIGSITAIRKGIG